MSDELEPLSGDEINAWAETIETVAPLWASEDADRQAAIIFSRRVLATLRVQRAPQLDDAAIERIWRRVIDAAHTRAHRECAKYDPANCDIFIALSDELKGGSAK